MPLAGPGSPAHDGQVTVELLVDGAELVATLSLLPVPAFAHPHIFIDAKFQVVAAPDGSISELRNVWSFDEVFSSSVLMDFDKGDNQTLTPTELKAGLKNLEGAVDALGEAFDGRHQAINGYGPDTAPGKPLFQ